MTRSADDEEADKADEENGAKINNRWQTNVKDDGNRKLFAIICVPLMEIVVLVLSYLLSFHFFLTCSRTLSAIIYRLFLHIFRSPL